MTGETMKVLMYLFGKLDFENFIQQTQIDVAEGLGMRKQNVNRAMQILTAKQNRTRRPEGLTIQMQA